MFFLERTFSADPKIKMRFQYNGAMSWVIWITGLPGSGKSTIAVNVKERIPDTVILRSDELRKIITPDPKYSGKERDYVYKALVYTAKTIYELGHNVVIDATGNRRFWRQLARKVIPDFFEVYLKCPVAVCRDREQLRTEKHGAPDRIYQKGESGAPVPGVTVPYEEPEDPSLIIDSEQETPAAAAEKIVRLVQS
jgi:adenylylsulfate kinase